MSEIPVPHGVTGRVGMIAMIQKAMPDARAIAALPHSATEGVADER
jgi:hypothetical protein